ncbi:Na+-transporting methylmalonyl-CoA/oxaloacetate decarboxylase beta subunit [Peptoniphilus olsenii]|uniref:Na+-transporting methylmalonyl-CoA/oxaloacetate decarboxylase beta subunit n=1 Tax=Peptoniphilus olsenii TaxID=411570 RepID=A0ABV2J9F3_9FIRM
MKLNKLLIKILIVLVLAISIIACNKKSSYREIPPGNGIIGGADGPTNIYVKTDI